MSRIVKSRVRRSVVAAEAEAEAEAEGPSIINKYVVVLYERGVCFDVL